MMDSNSEPDIVRLPRAYVHKTEQGIYLMLSKPPVLLKNPIHLSDQDRHPPDGGASVAE